MLIGKTGGKRPLGRHSHRYDNIKMDLKEKDVSYGLDVSG
jgi:hypothetical protein